MSEQIQPEPSSPPHHVPAAPDRDPLVQDLQRRIGILKRENRRWKLIGISALVVLLFVVISGGGLAVATTAFQARRAAEERLRAAEEAARARAEAEQQRQAAERAFQEAKRAAERLKKAE